MRLFRFFLSSIWPFELDFLADDFHPAIPLAVVIGRPFILGRLNCVFLTEMEEAEGLSGSADHTKSNWSLVRRIGCSAIRVLGGRCRCFGVRKQACMCLCGYGWEGASSVEMEGGSGNGETASNWESAPKSEIGETTSDQESTPNKSGERMTPQLHKFLPSSVYPLFSRQRGR